MDNKESVFDLISKQFSNEISEEELRSLRVWYDHNAENKKLYKEYYGLIKGLRIAKNKMYFESRTKSAFHNFLKKTNLSIANRRRGFINNSWMRYAAIFVIAFGMGITSYYAFSYRSIDKCLAQTIEIPFGSKSKITLPDGTSVWLNSGSRLSYNESFGHSDRDVLLDGEGYFEVTKNMNLPFRVLSGKTKIKVLGTKFNFKSYAEDENARVTLVEGSLNVADINDERRSVLLIPNQQAVIDKDQNKVTVKDVDAKNYAMWTEPKQEMLELAQNNVNGKAIPSIKTPKVILRNILFFDEEPLIQIVRDLERVFNIKVEINDEKLKKERFYGDFRNEETITEILDIMANNNNLYYTIKGNEIFISRK